MKIRIKTEKELEAIGWKYSDTWEAIEKDGHNALFDKGVISLVPEDRIITVTWDPIDNVCWLNDEKEYAIDTEWVAEILEDEK